MKSGAVSMVFGRSNFRTPEDALEDAARTITDPVVIIEHLDRFGRYLDYAWVWPEEYAIRLLKSNWRIKRILPLIGEPL